MKKPLIYPDLSYQIMGAAFEVHNELGPGFLEQLYEKAMMHELTRRGIPFERQRSVAISYKGEQIGTHILDLVVDGRVVLELKAVTELMPIHKQQTLSYLKATGIKLGILINFGCPQVKYERIANST
jgi:GxxExxY protein